MRERNHDHMTESHLQDLNFKLQQVEPLNHTLPSLKHLLNPIRFLISVDISHMGKSKMPVPGRRPGKQQVIEFSKAKMPDLHPSPSDDQRRSFKDVKRTAILAGLRAMRAPTVSCRHFCDLWAGNPNKHHYFQGSLWVG